jgi:replicative DNA helicase
MAKKSNLKIPPHNMEAEQSVLGSLLIDKNAILKVADVLMSADFYDPKHERIFAAILELWGNHQPVDVLSVTNFLKEKDFLKDIGGSSYLAELTNRIATASHVDHYAQIVKDNKARREAIKLAANMTEGAFDEDSIEDFLDKMEQQVMNISQKSVTQSFIPLQEELRTAYERIEKLHQGDGMTRGVPTGFQELDNILSGLQKSDLIIVGARPSLGKTTLALDMARNVAMKHKLPVGIFSLEMSREQIVDRLIAAESGVPLWKLRTGKIKNDADFQLIQTTLDRLSDAPVYIDDTPSPNIMQMRAMARRLQIEHGLSLLVVDYLQLIAPRTNSDNMVQQVTEISRGLKALARELNVPVLAVSQLSRAVDQRDNKMPRLSDLRESGSIEQDADVVMFLYRKDRERFDLPPEEQNIAQVSIAKHRNGPLGMTNLQFDQECVSFKPLEKKYEELAI